VVFRIFEIDPRSGVGFHHTWSSVIAFNSVEQDLPASHQQFDCGLPFLLCNHGSGS
jgi:hypothetical protein